MRSHTMGWTSLRPGFRGTVGAILFVGALVASTAWAGEGAQPDPDEVERVARRYVWAFFGGFDAATVRRLSHEGLNRAAPIEVFELMSEVAKKQLGDLLDVGEVKKRVEGPGRVGPAVNLKFEATFANGVTEVELNLAYQTDHEPAWGVGDVLIEDIVKSVDPPEGSAAALALAVVDSMKGDEEDFVRALPKPLREVWRPFHGHVAEVIGTLERRSVAEVRDERGMTTVVIAVEGDKRKGEIRVGMMWFFNEWVLIAFAWEADVKLRVDR